MKRITTTSLLLITSTLYAQTVPVQKPIEDRVKMNQWGWLLGVAIIIAIGIWVYMMIKKNPRKDAV